MPGIVLKNSRYILPVNPHHHHHHHNNNNDNHNKIIIIIIIIITAKSCRDLNKS